MATPIRDHWAQWLLERRHGGDPELREAQLAELAVFRDRVLQGAGIAPGETVLDVGAGDGLIAFGALDRVGERGTVIFSDISQDLLDHARSLAEQLGVLDRCRFLRASADDLRALPDAAVDVVTTRSVLIYVADKGRAFAEFHRVLRPGGRLSIFEPINRFAFPEPEGRFWGYDVLPVEDLARRVVAVYRRLQPPDRDPMLNFDERDLLAHAQEAGFAEVRLDLHAEVVRHQPRKWETFVASAGNPKIPTFGEAMRQALAPDEAARLTAHLRPLVERGEGLGRMALAYLSATKR